MIKGRQPVRRTPAEKKRLSYERDCRPCYGNNVKAACKAVPRNKAIEHRASRHRNNQALAMIPMLDESAIDLVESSARHDVSRVGGWTKGADVPLGEIVARQDEVRISRIGRKARSRAARL